jgi:spermidine synthase
MSLPKASFAPSGRLNLAVICACFALSGVSALVYQMAWTRQFALVFGTSELAVAAVLAAYMGGLALGAWLIEKRIRGINRPVLWYAGLEAGIAVAALIMIPLGLWLAETTLVAVFGGQPEPPSASLSGTSLFYLISAFAVLLVPTTLMGATLPLLTRHTVHSEQQIGRRIGLLYTCNTAGAVCGALMGALELLPRYGLHTTIWIAAAINLLVGLLALTLSKTSANEVISDIATPVGETTETGWPLRAAAIWVLPLMLLSGAVSFLHEVLWTHMLGHVLGSSVYAFGVMVASFLAGIALGGGLGAWLARTREWAARWLTAAELGAAVAAMYAWHGIQQISPTVNTLTQRVQFGFLLLFPLAFAIGLTYPLAVRVLARSVVDAAPASARVYAWNTVGAILGAIAGGFIIVPALRYEGAVQLAVLASCVLAVAAAFALFRPAKWFGVPALAAAVAAIALFKPAVPEALLRYSPLPVSGQGDLLYYDVGRSAAVTVLRQGDQFSVRTNGLPEASIDAAGTIPQLYVEAWMAPLAVLARPRTEDMLIVGFGGGRVVEAVPPSVRNVDVIELEDKVVDANQSIAARRLRNPLGDTRVNMILNDARGALQLTDKQYDAIVSQPSHPWTAGASHLYTREFMQQARDHLKPGGVFVQWMNVDYLDESLLRSLVATLNAVYPHVRVYRPAPPTLLFLASESIIAPEQQINATRGAIAAAPMHYARMGLNVVEDLLAMLALDDSTAREFAGDAAVITDDRNRFATANVYDFGRNLSATQLGTLLARYNPLQDTSSYIYRDLNGKIDYAYLGRRVGAYMQSDTSARDRLNNYANLFRNTDLQAYLQAVILQNSFQTAKSQELLLTAAQAHPDSKLLRDALLDAWLGPVAADTAPEQIRNLVRGASNIGQLTLQAATAATHNEWQQLAEMDTALEQVPFTSLLSNQAAQLRVEWRARVDNPDQRRRFAAESLAIIDRMSIVNSNPQLLLLRAWSTVGVNQPLQLLESIARYSQSVLQSRNVAEASTRADLRNGLATLARPLEQLAADPALDEHRYAEVHTLYTRAVTLVGS